jgi:hypothetical protein
MNGAPQQLDLLLVETLATLAHRAFDVAKEVDAHTSSMMDVFGYLQTCLPEFSGFLDELEDHPEDEFRFFCCRRSS